MEIRLHHRPHRVMFALTMILIAWALSPRCLLPTATGASLEESFVAPPDSAKPWVYWFWLNGNITREGITADLEAMKRVGIGGVLIMEVDQGAPVGPVDFMSHTWREMFKHVVSESKRLGLEVNMNNDAGWNGSGGPWIKPQQSMQKVVWSETKVEGPRHFEGALPQPPTTADFYRDVAVLAFPATGPFRIENINVKACYQVGGTGPAAETAAPPDSVIDRSRIVDLTSRLDKKGQVSWDAPAGAWTIVRFGHTSTGAVNAPAPATGRGLECDKLSKEGMEANYNGMMGKLIEDVGPGAGPTLVTTHIDSWENGAQNWTERMREEFQKRRGYDPLPYLPAMMGRVVDSLEKSERFLWDLRQTVSDLVVENYAGHLHTLAQQHGVKLSIEAYGGPCDDIPYAGRADEPMSEFWIGGFMYETCKEMASAAHIYGKPILGAEAFTANDSERWHEHPGSIKALGDRAFCTGVNRFVFHRYAMQPWLDRKPGMTMGPWGLHYERTNTWWEDAGAWHQYLARCQYLLRQGLFVADQCYLQPENAPQGYHPHPLNHYDFDNCSAEVVLTRMSVKNGRLVLPDGMSYRLLVLPENRAMTPGLVEKIAELVRAGATVVGPRPAKSPSLAGYPDCDEKVKQVTQEVWGDSDGNTVKLHRLGKGRVFWGMKPEQILAQDGVPPDFGGGPRLNYIHRTLDSAEIYFVANSQPQNMQAVCEFRVSGKAPELWWPETGHVERAVAYQPKESVTSVVLQLPPSGSVFVVFREGEKGVDPIVEATRDGKPVFSNAPSKSEIVVQKAVYGVLSDPQKTRDVRTKVQQLVGQGETTFPVARMAQGDDPAFNIIKTLIIDYTLNGKSRQIKGTDPETIDLVVPEASARIMALHRDAKGALLVEAWRAGRYELRTAGDKTLQAVVPALPDPLVVDGPWELQFPAETGAPAHITLDRLISWSEHPDAGVRYFSGAATYHKTFHVASDWIAKDRRLYLDLGNVEVMAAPKVNGRELGVLWKSPYCVEVTGIVKPGENTLEVRVVNQWINRMIGDEQLPDDSDRHPNGTLKSWPRWVGEGKPSPTGRYTFTSWRLWKKGEALAPSGLLGPVRIIPAAQIEVKEALAARAGVNR